MNCSGIQKLIPEYVDGQLDQSQRQSIQDHLDVCPSCQKVFQLHFQSWTMLSQHPHVEPSTDYMPVFWKRVAQMKPWHVRVLDGIREPRVVISLTGLAVVIVAGSFMIRMNPFLSRKLPASMELAQNHQPSTDVLDILESDENIAPEMIEDLEILENLELLEMMEFLEDDESVSNGRAARVNV